MKTRKTLGKKFQPYNEIIEQLAVHHTNNQPETLPEILVVTTFPPRQCGIATYSQDLIKAMNDHYVDSFSVKVCAIESNKEQHIYTDPAVKYTLNTSDPESYSQLTKAINEDENIKIVLFQHEFGLVHETVDSFNTFLTEVQKPVSVVFHTVLPNPDEAFKAKVQHILDNADSLIVMTNNAADILVRDYVVNREKISVIAHGTHLVSHGRSEELKRRHGFEGRTILSTFGLLSSGKSIETTLDALPKVVDKRPDVLFLIIGKTHPTVVLNEGEVYRESLIKKIKENNLQANVRFINKYVALDELLEYLQLTDIYLFTSKDPNQAVSGTFSYALSCGCPIISTPIPHAKEVLAGDTGVTFDFGNSEQLTEAINRLLFDPQLRETMVLNGLHKIVHTAWENSAVSHAKALQKTAPGGTIKLEYRNPKVKLDHVKNMTTDFGLVQFAKLNVPDLASGYTLDDNARAMITMCMHYKKYREADSLHYIDTYLNYIEYSQQADGSFLNYTDVNRNFTPQNHDENLQDSTGRAMWSLGYLISLGNVLPAEMVKKAKAIFHKTLPLTKHMYSTRAMAFVIKGLYYYNRFVKDDDTLIFMKMFADRMVQMYRHESDENWKWFEGYLTYANSVLPEALLLCYAVTGNTIYGEVAKESFDFLLSQTFENDMIKVVSNRGWQIKGERSERYGEQPIDVAYTILALRKFHDIYKSEEYLNKMETAFNWFLGNNHLQHVIYNPCTGGCFDGLEEHSVNLNQGAESTVSYLMARLTITKYFGNADTVYFRRKARAAKVSAIRA